MPVAPVSAEMINAIDSVLYAPPYGDVEPENVQEALLKFGNAIAAKAIELALAKKLPKARALAILIYQNTKKGKRTTAGANKTS